MNIINTYNDYLIHLNNERERTKNKFHASSAGSCFRKQLYSYYEYDRDEMDDKSFRLLRLGTVVHEDIEKAIRWKTELDKDSNYKVYVEEPVEVENLNLVGTFDVGVMNNINNVMTIYDIKTAAAYKWTTKFGLKKNRKPNTDTNYKLQLGTYALGAKDKFNPKSIMLMLLWYNKNTSAMREQIVSPQWINNALEYWEELNEILTEVGEDFVNNLDPMFTPNVPVQPWECKYCQYYSICPSTLADKKTKY